MSNTITGNLLVVLCASAAVAVVVMCLCGKRIDHFHTGINHQALAKLETAAKPSRYYSEGLLSGDNSKYFGSVAQVNDLPIACVSTLGGDIMMCPSSGICPLNGQRCQPSTHSKPCCNDNYPPKETWYYPNMPPVADYMYIS
jgi:hypothetical protein